jgi:hypothetical protein
VQHDFAIGARVKLMAEPFKLSFQVEEIIQLAVVAQNKAAIFAAHGLVTRGAEIDDAEPVVGESDAMLAIEVVASVVGPSMDDAIRHGVQIAIVASDAALKKPTAYSAHNSES